MPAFPCLRVLVADDSDIVRRLVVETLADVPQVCIVGEASGGYEALDRLREQVPDVLVLDLNMPEGDGLHVLRHLPASGQRPRVLVLTQHTGPEYRDACTELGAVGFFDKATEIEQVAATLRGWAEA